MARRPERILITGANGFIGQNLVVKLSELGGFQTKSFVRTDDPSELRALVSAADAIVHLAGENRTEDPSDFERTNVNLTESICEAIEGEIDAHGRHIPLVFTSSSQAQLDNAYGRSKLAAENVLRAFAKRTSNPVVIFRLPGVFGKWCKPNYNSVVATFCHRIARGEPIRIDERGAELRLVYIDDVLTAISEELREPAPGLVFAEINTVYVTTVGSLADQIMAFKMGRGELFAERVGSGFLRALYATYLTYIPPEDFSYNVPRHLDRRGEFVEMLKTRDSGQFSFFTAHPGITRGGHYHHSKSEKFLVIRGCARFRFRHLVSGAAHTIDTTGSVPQIVETIPGWTHDVTNIGEDDLIVALWSNEVFDPDHPDTISSEV